MKKIGLILVGLISIMLLVGCAEKTIENKEEKKEKKIIKVGMEVAYPPYEYFKKDKTTITGIDHDIAVAIGKELGYEIEFVNTKWDNIFKDLDEKKYDVIISAVTATDEIKAKYDLSVPYIQNYQCLVTRVTAKLKPTDMNMLNNTIIGCLEESTSASYLKSYVKKHKMKVTQIDYDVISEAFTDLKNKKLHAIMCDSVLAKQYCKNPEYIMTWKQDKDPEEFVMCFRKGSKYAADFNKVIEKLRKNGELDKIINLYLDK